MKKVITAVISVFVAAVMLVVPAAAASKLAAPAKFRAAAKSTSAISLSWSAVEGATKYTIYYSTAKKGEYKKYGSVTKTTATVKKLDAGTKYFFRVTASGTIGGKSVTGSYSETSAITKTEEEKAEEAAGFKIIKSPGRVQNGRKATLKIQGAPNTEYSLFVHYPSKNGEAKGIGKQTSDADGIVSWTWTVGTRTTPGKHVITVKSAHKSYSLGAILETYKKNG